MVKERALQAGREPFTGHKAYYVECLRVDESRWEERG